MKQIIKLDDGVASIVDDKWQLIDSDNGINLNIKQNIILPIKIWLNEAQKSASQNLTQCGVWLSPDDDVEQLESWLHSLPLIAIQFPSFRDGRGYTQAYILRTRLGWAGELRAFGDVLRDQLSLMRQCGFTSFAIREDKSVMDALKGLQGISVLYGNSVIEPKPLFRRR